MAARGHEASGVKQNIRPVITGLITGLIVTIIMFLLFSLWITLQDTPQGLIDPMAVMSLSAGAFVAGLVCARITRTRGLMYGAGCGLAISLLVISAGLMTGAGGIGLPGALRVAFIMLCAMAGGITGVNLRAKPKR